MARRRHRRSRRYGAYVSFPSLSGIPLVKSDVKALDVFLGAGVGYVGQVAVDMVLQRALPAATYAQVASTVGKAFPALTGAAAGAALYFGNKKLANNAKRGAGMAVGAVAVGLAMTVRNFLAGQSFLGMTFNEVAVLNLNRYNGLIVDNPRPMGNYGMLVDNTSGQNNLGRLGAMSMGDAGDEGNDGFAELAAMQGRR